MNAFGLQRRPWLEVLRNLSAGSYLLGASLLAAVLVGGNPAQSISSKTIDYAALNKPAIEPVADQSGENKSDKSNQKEQVPKAVVPSAVAAKKSKVRVTSRTTEGKKAETIQNAYNVKEYDLQQFVATKTLPLAEKRDPVREPTEAGWLDVLVKTQY